MSIKRILCLLLALLWVGMPLRVYAEAVGDVRNIYVGDIITLDIATKNYSAEQLSEKFHDFEIVEIKEKTDGYLLSLRTFKTGEQSVLIGDKEIVINVESTLNDIQREGIFEGDVSVIEPGFPFHWRILFYIAAGIFALSGGFVLLKTILKRKTKTLSPHQIFLSRSGALSDADDNYLVDLTLCFKEYLESLYQCRIIGKTSAEIIFELKRLQILDTMLPEVQEWLTECDRLKFTGIRVSRDEKQDHYGKLLNLVTKIDIQKQTSNKEGVV